MDDDTTWAITKITPGPGLDVVLPGQWVRLTADDHSGFSIVCTYVPA